ncbi:putative serine protease F56F10.1 [Malaya genurostris]|uniref:putative serine protease F56F10.1 n=1 Tax=Malaya genurostris TaxID=325434 RepID=UPI0026F3AFCE|nr:putative serine protease F56F10.1 [Malaya genurostris]
MINRNTSAVLVLLVILFANYQVQCTRKFWRGKQFSTDSPSRHWSFQGLSDNVQTLWFDQILDHNDPTNPATWKQRYYVNDRFFNSSSGNGPVFLMIGGEGEATARWMNEGAWIHYAEQYGALCFQLEHRFYGKSQPTKNLATENLLYLTSEQALADLAYFIEAINNKYKLTEQNFWIAFGGSYPGSLAAWLREKYPHLIHGAISSSGPLLAKIDFKEYFQVVVDSLGQYSEQCVTDIHSAMSQIETLLKHMIGQRSLTEKFKLCDPVEKSISNPLDIASLFEAVASNFAGVVQYNKDNSPHAKITIDQVCEIMTNQSIGVPVNRLAEVNKLVMIQDGEKCLDYVYNKTIKQMQNTSWDAEVASGARQWTYQTCNEFGFYQTSDESDSVFGNRFPVDFFIQQCLDIYGEKFNSETLKRAVYRTNTNYGALNPPTTNVLYVHGSIDPWHRLGLIYSNDLKRPTIFINGTAHCANMYEPKDDDFPQLKAARAEINDFIGNILKSDSN